MGVASLVFIKCGTGLYGVTLLVLLMALTPVGVNAAVPTSETEIPLVPGSIPDAQEEAVWEQYGSEGVSLFVAGAQLPLASEHHAFYTTDAPLEDVARYYTMKLDVVDSSDWGDTLSSLPAGESTPVSVDYAIYDWQFEDEYGIEGELIRSGAMVRDTLANNRIPHSTGEWLSRAAFSWTHRASDGNLILLEVDCEDRSFGEDYAEFQGTQTLIAIHRYTYVSEEDVWEMEDAAMDAQIADLATRMALSPPTSEELGVPIYPGSEFQPEISAGMSLSDTVAYIFFTVDTPADVINWYEQAIGQPSESWAEDSYAIALSGQLPFPDRGLTVQPNVLFGGLWKTVITLLVAGGTSDEYRE